MLIKKKKLAKKNGHHEDEVKKVLVNNIKPSKEISFASNEDIEDSLDALYQNYSDFPEPRAQSLEPIMSEEEINARAQDLIEAKAEELFAKFQSDIKHRQAKAEAEIAQMFDDARANAENQSANIINDANAKAEEVQAELNRQNQIIEKAKADFEKTVVIEKKKAYEEGISEAQEQIDEFVKVLTSFNRVKEELIEEIKPQIVSIAFDVAKQILDYEIEINPNIIEEQVTKAVSRLVNTKGVMQIYLNPEDVKHADYLDTVLSRLLDSSVRLIFMKDESVDKGSCVINTQGGRLDSRFSTQLQIIKVAFEKYLGHKVDDIDNLKEDLEIIEEPDLEDPEMAKKIIKPNENSKSLEPSDEDLDLLEDDPEALIDLDMDEDLDSLLQDVMLDEDTGDSKDAKKPKKESFKVDHDDSTDLGANDFANGDDLDLDTELNVDSDDGPEIEEFDEFAGDDELGSDSNFDGSQMDERFPEY